MRNPTTSRDRRHRAIAAVFLFVAIAIVALWLAGCGRAEAQAGTFQPVTGYTDCGINGALVMLNTTVQYDPLVPETETARWGPCSGRSGSIAGCNDNELNRWGEKRCIATESEESVIKEALRWEYSGSCSPPRDTPYPSKQLVEDYGKVVGAYSGRSGLRTRWEAACFARPSPAPPPAPTPIATPTVPPTAPTPSLPPPQATPTPSPSPTPCPTCPQFDRVTVPPKHARTVEFAGTWSADNEAKLVERFKRLQALAVWLGEQLDKLYVPNVRSTPNITSTIEPCKDLGGGCWHCGDPLTGPVCVEVAP